MIRSLRGRLFAGLTAIILLTGIAGGLFAHHWAFDEAIEMRDSVLIQIAALVQSANLTGGRELHGVDEDAEVWLIEQSATPPSDNGELKLWGLKDGLALATRREQPIRVLLRTRPDGTRFAVAQRTSVRDEIASDMGFAPCCRSRRSFPACCWSPPSLSRARCGRWFALPAVSTEDVPTT